MGTNDPQFGYVYFYTGNASKAQAQVIHATHGQQAQFIDDDQFGQQHTASGLGTSFPPSFNNTSGHTQSGSVIDGGTTWSTGDLDPKNKPKSQVFTIGPPGTYYFGCAFHYTQPPNKNNGSMGDVLVSS